MRGPAALSLLLAAAAPAANGQLVGNFLAVRPFQSLGHSYSGTFVSSSSWVAGKDGQMHQQLHQEQHVEVRDGSAVQLKHSETDCRDGLCQQTVQVAQPMGQWMPPCLRGMIARVRHGHMFARALPLRVVRAAPLEEVRAMPAGPVRVGLVAAPAAMAPAMDNPKYRSSAENLKFIVAGGAVAVIAGAAVIAALLKCHLLGAASAREQPMRALGQPLAPAQEAVSGTWRAWLEEAKRSEALDAAAEPSAPSDPEAEAVKAYMCSMYGQAAARSDAQVLKAYLSRVYARAA